jgi:8-oxo-dGTP pyrophosphatase MutT (NUDIX family)
VLLTHHRKLGRWLQLGGHADGDEDALRVALREAREESGLDVAPVSSRLFDVDVHEIPARGPDPVHLHYDLRFAIRAIASEAFRVSDESHALRWVSIDRIRTLTEETSILRMAAKWRTRGWLTGPDPRG